MAADIMILAVMVLTIFLTMRKGFAMSVVGFFKGFVSLVIAWLFCDDLAEWLMSDTAAGAVIAEKIGDGLSSKWESSDIYMALPDLFKGGASGYGTEALISDGSAKITGLLLTILCFAAIIFLLRGVLTLVCSAFSHRNNEGFVGAMDWLLGLLLGAVLGVLNVFVFLALLLPAVGLFMPEHCEAVMGWLGSSVIAGDLYNNNLLLILFRDFLNFTV